MTSTSASSRLTEIAKISPEERAKLTARDVARTDVPAAHPSDSVADIAAIIREHDADAVTIIDDGHITGIVTIRDISNVERLLDRLETEADP